MSDCCQLDSAALEQRQKRVLIAVLLINLATFVMMVAGSLMSGSSALLSGTLDNLGDALTYAISFAVVGASVAAKARVAFLKGLLILFAAVLVAIAIAWRLIEPETPLFATMGTVAVANLIANGCCLWLLTPFRQSDINMASV